MHKIPFFDYQRAFSGWVDDFVEILRDTIGRGAFILQAAVQEFEDHLSEYLGIKHVIGVANCTDAMIIALRAAGLEPGDEVISPSHTMVATPAAIVHAGATPVLVDCGPDHLIAPDSIRGAITSRTRAIMPVQLNGRTADMDTIQKIADQYGLLIIEDSAQALGSKYKGRYAGTFGLAGTFSFYPAKILGCLGDGGAIVTDDDEMARKIHLYRDHGRDENGEVVLWGLNSRLDTIQAAFLDRQFQVFETVISRRREMAGAFQEQLADVSGVVLPPAPDSDHNRRDVYQNYEIEAENRDDLQIWLSDMGIGTMIQWGGKAVHQYRALGFDTVLPATEQLFERCLMLPMNMSLSDEDIEYICEAVRGFYVRGM